MRQSFKYNEEVIEKVMATRHGISNIDIGEADKLSDAIENIIEFISLGDKLKLIRSRSNSNGIVEFTIEAIGSKTSQEFQEHIKKFQNHLTQFSLDNAPVNSEIIIAEIQGLINKFPSDHEIFIGTTHKVENIIKVECGLPKYWAYRRVPTSLSGVILDYFVKQGYTCHSGQGAAAKLYTFATPKTGANNLNLGQRIGCVLVIVLIVVALISWCLLLW